MTDAGAGLQVHPAGVTLASSRLEAAGLVVRRPQLPAGGVRSMAETLQALRRDAGDFGQ